MASAGIPVSIAVDVDFVVVLEVVAVSVVGMLIRLVAFTAHLDRDVPCNITKVIDDKIRTAKFRPDENAEVVQ